MYKIGLISTHGTGKTTLTYTITGELKKQGIKVRPISEIATKALERGFPINKGTTLEAQAWIFHTQCALELEAEMYGYEVGICDRTVLDNYCYMENSLGKQKEYLYMVLNHMKKHPYNKLYLVPITQNGLQEDSVRDTDTTFQRQIDIKLRNYLEDLKIEYTELPIPKPNDLLRQEWTKQIIENTLKDLGRKTLFDF